MRKDAPPIERASSIKLSMVLALIGYLSIILSLVYYVFVPKQVSFHTTPDGATVYTNGFVRCRSTPCEIGLNRILPKTVTLERPHYFPYTIELPFFGMGWDKLLNKQVELKPVIDPQERQKAVEICREERALLSGQSEMDAVPCYRVPPIMPSYAFRSGHCRVVFDVSKKGKPRNIRLTGCTDAVFADPAKQSVSLWEYLPAIKDSEPIVREGIETQITFKLTDEYGRLIPEPPVLDPDNPHEHAIAVDTDDIKDGNKDD